MDEAELHASPLAERLEAILEGAYELEREVGRGGMGVVFAARDLSLKRRVAIKVLPPELAYRTEIKTRFMREAQTAARLSHPHIVPVHSVGDEGGLVYFVMGFVDGESLGGRLKRRKALPVEEVRRIMKETADALSMAHAMGVIHRDIKPDNVLLEGTRRRVMVTDFGIAKALSEASPGTLTGTGVAIGTPYYMSPEQAAGEREIDHRSDLYALGVVAYEMATGELPFNAPTVPGILMKQITEPAPDIKRLRPEMPDDLAASIMRCLEKDPQARWPTADSLRRALESRKSIPYRPAARSASRRIHTQPRGGTDRERSWERSERRPARRGDRALSTIDGPGERTAKEPTIVRGFRADFAQWVSVCGGLTLINVATGITEPWSLFVWGIWGFSIGAKYRRLWLAGYSWRDVLNRPPAADAIEARMPPKPRKAVKGKHAPVLPEATLPDDFGPLADQIKQLTRDRQAINAIVEKLPESERKMLPDVTETVERLSARALDLARTLGHMEGEIDPDALVRLDERLAQLTDEGNTDDRRLQLLERQREGLVELMERRHSIEAQFESCVLAVQNVRFDLLRLRSAGVAAVLDDLTSATQAAKALSFDVEAAIDAAGEIREELRR